MRYLALMLAIAFLPVQSMAGEWQLLQEFRWKERHEKFGGFSGFEIDRNGLDFWAVSDGGYFVKSRLARDGSGQITGVESFNPLILKFPNGRQVHSFLDDAEGLAVSDDGQIAVSFEGVHRIWAIPRRARMRQRWARTLTLRAFKTTPPWKRLPLIPRATF